MRFRVCAVLFIWMMGVSTGFGQAKIEPKTLLDISFPVLYLEVEGTKIAYVDEGKKDKPVLVFVHGYFVDHSCWNFTLKALENHFRLIALDLPGSGLSDKPLDAPYTPGYYAKILVSFLHKLKLQKVTLLGISMGGLISVKTTALAPQLIARLVLVDSAGMVFFSPMIRKKMMEQQTVENYMARREEDYRKALSIFFRKTDVPGFELVMRSVERRKKGDYEAFLKAQIKSWDGMMSSGGYIAPLLGQIKVPTQIIWGKQDGPLNFALGYQMHKGIKGSRFNLIEDSGHIPMLEEPEQFNQLLYAFLTSN